MKAHARTIAIASLALQCVMLLASLVIWVLAIMTGWIDSVKFVSHVSMLALVFSSVSGIAAGLAAWFAEEADSSE